MKKYKLIVLSLFSIMFFLISETSAQIAEFEGTTRITSKGQFPLPNLELYAGNKRVSRITNFFNKTTFTSYLGNLEFVVANDATYKPRMTIQASSGNIGIGATGPSAQLDIRHNSLVSSAHLELDETTTNDYARIKMINSGNGTGDFWDIAGRASSIPTVGASPTNPSSLNIFYHDEVRYQTGVNLLRIEPYVNDFAMYSATFNFRGNVIPEVDNSYFVGVPARRWNRVYSVNGVSTTSDIRMKKNISELPYGLADLMNLNPVRYDWKDENDTAPQIGLIAQEVLKVIPEVVQATETKVDLISGKESLVEAEVYSMNYDMLIPVLIKSIQDQQMIIDDLNRRLLAVEK